MLLEAQLLVTELPSGRPDDRRRPDRPLPCLLTSPRPKSASTSPWAAARSDFSRPSRRTSRLLLQRRSMTGCTPPVVGWFKKESAAIVTGWTRPRVGEVFWLFQYSPRELDERRRDRGTSPAAPDTELDGQPVPRPRRARCGCGPSTAGRRVGGGGRRVRHAQAAGRPAHAHRVDLPGQRKRVPPRPLDVRWEVSQALQSRTGTPLDAHDFDERGLLVRLCGVRSRCRVVGIPPSRFT